MPNVPEEWKKGEKKSLNVYDLGLKGVPAANLFIYKLPPSKNCKLLKCRWLPDEEEDTRPFKGRTNRGKGKRKYLEGNTGYEDPIDAGKRAIIWCKEQRRKLQKLGASENNQSRYNLHYYWEIWYSKFCNKGGVKERNKKDRLNDWNGKDFGIAHQKWSLIPVDEISKRDIYDYFHFLGTLGDGKKGSGASRKKQQKAILNKLNEEASVDFPDLREFKYPQIEGRQSIQKEHFLKDEWRTLLEKVNELSGGFATQSISKKEYENIEWSSRDRFNQRNWVDLYDCLTLMFYFLLRSEDIPRIKNDEFKKVEGGVVLHLEKPKKHRLVQDTQSFYPDTANEIWERVQLRRPTGYLAFPYLPRIEGNENDSHVVETANELLKEAIQLCKIKKRYPVTLTTIRHTSIRLTLEDMPPLVDEQKIRLFADNANSGIESFRKHYLKYEQRTDFISEVSKAMPKHDWALQKRVSLD